MLIASAVELEFRTRSVGDDHLVEQSTVALAAVRRVVASGGGLIRMIAPEGELGRPGDNLYRLTFGEARPNKLLIELDTQLLLVLTMPDVVAASDEAVRLAFGQLTLDWQEYGNMRPHASSWTTGHLDLMAQSTY